ncbi:MAG: hypothetical protein EAX95_04410 [Candidatus Thorarchaeota archaeon]|nr:hypothetical protein [Candidatus Thorarchaeota archaeon]
MLLPRVVICGNFGLEWGVRVGDRFNYTLQADFAGEPFSGSVYVQVDALPDLDEPFSPYVVFPIAIASFYWANGSHFGLVDYSTSFLIVPIGNWTYLTTEMTPQLASYVSGHIIDTIMVWGLEVSTYVLNMLWVIHVEISKSDGVPNLMHIQIYDGNLVYGDIHIVREGTLGPLLLGVSVALIVVFSVIILLWQRYPIARGRRI